ncbi:hypothetical protein SDC9_135495 [bioreactor metagenome]|uniref:YokE-like PH domain-containing protein n=1 Tax=bioreactor metagenome TaxID=1076179 RepID=A0A645DIH0_9ZZZZ
MSTNFKDRLIRIDDIPGESERLLEQGNKPYLPLTLFLLIGAALLFIPNVRIVGAAILVFIVYILFGTKERKLFTITDKYIIIYLYNNDRECNIFYLDEIISWEYKTGKPTLDVIELKLNDGSVHTLETTGPNKAIKVMRDLLADREIKPASAKRH